MSPNQSSDLIAIEARRLLSLPREARESEGVYATNHDLKGLIKSVSSHGNWTTTSSADSLGRRVGDFARPESKLFQLVFATIEGHEK